MGIILNFTADPEISLEEIDRAADIIKEEAHPDARIIWGMAFDENLEDELRITVIATGFEEAPTTKKAEPAAEAKSPASAPAAMPVEHAYETPSQNLFSGAFERAAESQGTAPQNPDDEDPFDSIFKIFNAK